MYEDSEGYLKPDLVAHISAATWYDSHYEPNSKLSTILFRRLLLGQSILVFKPISHGHGT